MVIPVELYQEIHYKPLITKVESNLALHNLQHLAKHCENGNSFGKKYFINIHFAESSGFSDFK